MSYPDPRFIPENPTLLQALALRIGRRGCKLLGAGLAFMIYGLDIAASPRTERFSRPGPSPLDWADSRAWGWMFIVSGMIAVAVGLQRRRAPDAIGFAFAVLPPVVWSGLNLLSFTVHNATGGQFGEPDRLAPAAVWLVIAFNLRIDAGWDDSTDPIHLSPTGASWLRRIRSDRAS